jgi:signal transduction histidine kinase
VQGDPHRLHQVFANLLENSLRITLWLPLLENPVP